MQCERCKKETRASTCSYFNEQQICMDCEAKEKRRSDYKIAVEAENNAVRQGDNFFPGIGLYFPKAGKLQVSIVESGSGDIYNVGDPVDTLEQAKNLVNQLEVDWEAWCSKDFPKLEKDDPILHYEGCDVYATDMDLGTKYFLDGDEWDLLE